MNECCFASPFYLSACTSLRFNTKNLSYWLWECTINDRNLYKQKLSWPSSIWVQGFLRCSSAKETAKTSFSSLRYLNKTKFHRLKCKIPRRRWHRHSFFTLVTCQNIDHKIKLEFELWHPANPWPHLSSHHQSILGIAWFCIKHYSQDLRIIRWIFGYFFDTPCLRNAFLSIFWRVFMRLYNSHLLRGSSLKNIHSSSWNRASLRSQLENREIFCPFRCRHLTMIKSVVFWLFLGQSYFRQN